MPGYEDLESRIIDTGECTVCGACVSACPGSHIKLPDGKPRRPKRAMDCVGCSICYDACYMLRHNLIKEIEAAAIGRGHRDSVGLYRRAVMARTKDPEIARICQDGGFITTLLTYGLRSGMIDGALLVVGDGWAPRASIARDRDEVIQAAGTRYGPVPVLKTLRSAVVDEGLGSICVVGTPCHIQSIRYLKHKGLPLASPVKLTVGLLCRENYQYSCLVERLAAKGVDIDQVDKLDVSDEFNIYTDGNLVSFPVTEVKGCVPRHCLVCRDFAAEVADIAVGSDGAPEGWSTVLVRTELGYEVLAGMERAEVIDTEPMGEVAVIEEIADRKKEKAKQTREIFRLHDQGLSEKEIAARLEITAERVSHRLERR